MEKTKCAFVVVVLYVAAVLAAAVLPSSVVVRSVLRAAVRRGALVALPHPCVLAGECNLRCENPVSVNGLLVRCGQCEPDRASRASLWAHRIILEAGDHENNAFVTLTYSDEHLPSGGSLVPKHVQDFLKRIRNSVHPSRLRFFAVGEYGDKTSRPHYHLMLFGLPTCEHGTTRHSISRRTDTLCCASCDRVQRCWHYGEVHLGTVEKQSAAYISQYVLKKLTRTDDPRLKGRWPEFARMSLRPGLGAYAMDDVADTWLTLNLEQKQSDIPVTLLYGNNHRPIGRYLQSQLRKKVGINEDDAKILRMAAAQAELQQLRETDENIPLKEAYRQKYAQDILNWKTRRKIKAKGKSL